ncbi:hypothetical protein V501_09276 [Pseudogymnoascus sp. VKM F-4519 (FW-2642)]|nr:hypothetical protein V501_09276 [Pseudogymnoascus sp. VKM F-4519 (FW-2642)]
MPPQKRIIRQTRRHPRLNPNPRFPRLSPKRHLTRPPHLRHNTRPALRAITLPNRHPAHREHGTVKQQFPRRGVEELGVRGVDGRDEHDARGAEEAEGVQRRVEEAVVPAAAVGVAGYEAGDQGAGGVVGFEDAVAAGLGEGGVEEVVEV